MFLSLLSVVKDTIFAGMSSFVVSARKHRPVAFSQVFGQSHITTTLEHAIKSEKSAQAMLFCGPRGVGKTTCARIFAHQINNFSDQDPTQSTHMLNIFELDAASNNSVEDIRHLIEQVRFPPQQGKYKIYIIDEVHMLSQQAFNAFLKTLEEPPSYVIFILATTEKQKVLPTILSRCQIYHFKRIAVPDIVLCLKKVCKKEKLKAEEEALYHIGRKADGSLRDALSLFDMLVTACKGESLTYARLQAHLDLLDSSFFFELTAHLKEGRLAEGLLILDKALQQGVDLHQILLAWSEVLRDLLLAKDLKTEPLTQLGSTHLTSYRKQAEQFTNEFLLSALDTLNVGEQQYKQSQYPRLHLELLLAKIRHYKQPEQPLLPSVEKKSIAQPESRTDNADKDALPVRPLKSSKSTTQLPSTPSLRLSEETSIVKKKPNSTAKEEDTTTKPSSDSSTTKTTPYTDQEKLDHLAKKYPDLKDLQSRFDLEGEL